MRPSWAREAQTEPFAALVAVAVVGLALGAYAGAFEAAVPDPVDRNPAQQTADRVERALTVGGVVRPERLADATDAGPSGYRVNATLVAGNTTLSTGPEAPETADTATRRVSVHRGAGTVAPGRLEVHVWT